MKKFLPIISAILIVLPFYIPNFFFLALIGLLPLLISFKNANVKQSIKYGWIFGFALVTFSGYWLFFPLYNFSGLPLPAVILVLFLLFSLLAIFYGLTAGLLKNIGLTPFRLAVCWTAIEFLRYKILPHFSVGYLGYTQTSYSHLLQWADLGGIFLITFIVLLINGILYKLLITKHKKYLIILIITLIIISSYGVYRLNTLNTTNISEIKIGVVRSSIPQEVKWRPAKIESNIDHIFKQIEEAERETPKLIVTPETAFTFDLTRNEYYRNMVQEKIKKINIPIQTGSQSIMDQPGKKYNSSFLISDNGKIDQRYNKNDLLPFGEKIPLQNFVKIITGKKWSSLQEGSKKTIFKQDFAKWQVLICSEIMQTKPVSLIEKTGFIINQSNEAWFDSGVQQLMWNAAIFRAVENRRSVIKSGNFSYVGVVYPSGKYINDTLLSKPSYLITDIPLKNNITYYQKWGNIMGYGVLILLGIYLIDFKLIKNIISSKENHDENNRKYPRN
ncbi:MAG: apolipoprotein N-acyltransferase [Bacillota bacterium]